MVKLVSLKKSAGDRAAEKDAVGESGLAEPAGGEGNVSVNLEHHHLMKLKGSDGEPMAGRMKSGDNVEFHGRGTVERSETRSTQDGERHSATLRLDKGAVEHDPAERDGQEGRADLKEEIAKNVSKMETEAK